MMTFRIRHFIVSNFSPTGIATEGQKIIIIMYIQGVAKITIGNIYILETITDMLFEISGSVYPYYT